MDISVVVPVYNTSAWLEECVDSILSIAGILALEILLVDDESTDNSREILQRYAANHPNVSAIFQSHGRQGKARNNGLDHAKGKYILFLDSDDKLYKNTLIKFFMYAEENCSDFVVGKARSFSGIKKWINEGYTVYNQAKKCTDISAFPELIFDPSTCNKLYRHEFLKNNKIRFPEDSYCEDVYFSYKASLLAQRVSVLPEIIHEYRGRESTDLPSGTQTFTPERLIQCARIYRRCLEEYQKEAPSIISLLEERTIIRFKRFFRRMESYPDAGNNLYIEMKSMLELIAVDTIMKHSECFAVPFLMIRQGYFRHAVANLVAPENRVAIEDFFQKETFDNRNDISFLLSSVSSSLIINNSQASNTNVLNTIATITSTTRQIRCLYRHAKRIRAKIVRENKAATELIKKLGYFFIFKSFLMLARPLIRIITKKRVWLIAERDGLGAEENGYVFFKYCQKSDKSKSVYYILNKNVDAPADLSESEKFIRKMTWEYFYTLCLADTFIFTNTIEDICNRFVIGRFRKDINMIFLTHGVTLYGPGVYLRGKADQFSKIIAISEVEKRQKLRDWQVQYPEKFVVTGLPRFDELYDTVANNEIIFCLTWRKHLDSLSHEEFKNSTYYKIIISLLNNPELAAFLRTSGMCLRLRFHFRMKEFGSLFDNFPSENVLIEYSDSVVPLRDVLKKAAVLITDYSSILWDMAYMQRPVILYQFDVDAFLAERGLHAFSTDEDSMSFATVVQNEAALLAKLNDLRARSFQLTEEQKRNARSFFQFHDANNCERVYQMIVQEEMKA